MAAKSAEKKVKIVMRRNHGERVADRTKYEVPEAEAAELIALGVAKLVKAEG